MLKQQKIDAKRLSKETPKENAERLQDMASRMANLRAKETEEKTAQRQEKDRTAKARKKKG